MSTDHYQATASAYDLFAAPYQTAQIAALERTLPRFLPTAGPILDVGAGSGAISEQVLRLLPDAGIVALEPSAAMRALILGRIARHPDWFPRITVRAEGFLDAQLPERIGGAIALGVLGHFDTAERQALLASLARRLPAGAGLLVDLQDPETPRRVEAHEFTAATVGDIEYRGIAEAWPLGDDMMRWRMTYRTLERDRVLSEESIEHVYHHPSPDQFREEAQASGFDPNRLDAGSFWILVRV